MNRRKRRKQKDKIELDIERLGLLKGNLEISVVEQKAGVLAVEINTYCARGRKHVRQTHEYTVGTMESVIQELVKLLWGDYCLRK